MPIAVGSVQEERSTANDKEGNGIFRLRKTGKNFQKEKGAMLAHE